MSDTTFVSSVFYKDPRAALDWLQEAFGFELTMLIEDADGGVAHAELGVGGRGRIMVGGEWADWTRSPVSVDGTNTQAVHVDLQSDLDVHCEQARAAGAVIVAEPEDQFYGARTYRAVDPEGHMWTFSMPVREVTREEAERASGLKIEAEDWA